MVLVPHLAEEEEAVIPLLLALPPSEFDRLQRYGIARLLHEVAKAWRSKRDEAG